MHVVENFDRIGEENAFTVLARAGALAAEDARRALSDLIELIEATSGDERDGRPLAWF